MSLQTRRVESIEGNRTRKATPCRTESCNHLNHVVRKKERIEPRTSHNKKRENFQKIDFFWRKTNMREAALILTNQSWWKIFIYFLITVSLIFTGVTIFEKILNLGAFGFTFLREKWTNYNQIPKSKNIFAKIRSLRSDLDEWPTDDPPKNSELFDAFNRLAQKVDNLNLTPNQNILSTDSTLQVIAKFSDEILMTSLERIMEYWDMQKDFHEPFDPEDLDLMQMSVLLDTVARTVMFYRTYAHIALRTVTLSRAEMIKAADKILNLLIQETGHLGHKKWLESKNYGNHKVKNYMKINAQNFTQYLPMHNWDQQMADKKIDLMGKAFFETQLFIRELFARECEKIKTLPGMANFLARFPYKLQDSATDYLVLTGSIGQQLKIIDGYFAQHLTNYVQSDAKHLIELLNGEKFPHIQNYENGESLARILSDWERNPQYFHKVQWSKIIHKKKHPTQHF